MATARAQLPFPPESRHWTPAQWLEWEEQQAERWEYLGNEPHLVAGGTLRHADIGANVLIALKRRLQGKPCRPYMADVKAMLPTGRWAYPDVVVSCGRHHPTETKLDDAVVIVEVLSPSTANYDLENKRIDYYKIASLRHVLFVLQSRVEVELTVKTPIGTWESGLFDRLDQSVVLEALGIELPLGEIYEGIELDEPL